MAITIYPDTVNGYKTSNSSWSSLRNGNSSVVETTSVNDTSTAHRITNEYKFIRAYIQFDLSGVTEPITSMRLYLYGTSTNPNTGLISYIVAGGQDALNNDATDYPLYLSNVISNTPLSTVAIATTEYVSCLLDIATYPPSEPPGYYVIGIVADKDFLNLTNELFAETVVDNNTNPPYLVINETSPGYPYIVNGVPAASIGEVSGVLSSNIVNIIGV
jgi:hypothetical protein